MQEAKDFARKVSYPVLIRPSYVLSGAAMNVALDEAQLEEYLTMATDLAPDHPVVITKFVTGAREIELDAVASQGGMVNWAISEHIENAGVHSGDATMILPSDTIPAQVRSQIMDIGAKIANSLEISGPFNMQFLVKGNDVSVIECNLRASRSFPFVSKTYDIDFIETATKIFLGQKVEPNYNCNRQLKYVGVKAPQFSFQRLLGADPVLGVEMASTGEVACFGDNKYEAFLKAMISVPPYFRFPDKTKNILVSGNITQEFLATAQNFVKGGFKLFAVGDAVKLLEKNKIPFTALEEPVLESKSENNSITWVTQKKLDLVVNFPRVKEDESNYVLRRKSVDFGVPCLTNEQVVHFLSEALIRVKDFPIKSYDEYLATHND
jgi:predicted ATP-grasp superfamily ATP-dependent carboligase